MDRRLLFPAIAMSALAQTTSPANAEAEKALRARAEQFYKLEVDKKFRQAEGFVAEDTKDYFYTNGKPDIKSFKVGAIEISKDGLRGTVSLSATVILVAPGMGSQEFSVPSQTTWKVENGQWVWYFEQPNIIKTPFGDWRAGSVESNGSAAPVTITDMQGLITIDRKLLDLTPGNDTVTITNHLPGSIGLELGSVRPEGLITSIDKTSLATNEKAIVSFRAAAGSKPSGTVRITTSPLGQEFVIQVKTK